MARSLMIVVLAAGALTLAGCGKKPSPAEISAMAPSDGTGSTEGGDSEDEGPGSQADLRRSAGSDKVYFDFDSFGLSDESQETLRRQALWLTANPRKIITIEGHCDERGTRDYNIALGARRANSAKNFLAAQGVSVARMSTISYGKERPDATGSDEQAYALNRRAVSVVVR